MYQHRAKKSMGQNFLTNQTVVEKIRDAANLTANDIVLEIGPGQGMLTKTLLTFARKVVAVEKDDNLFMHLNERFAQEVLENRLDLVSGDILEFDPEILRSYSSYKLIANIPYNITGAIIEKFLSTSFQPSMMVLMVQKEVAERIIAKNKKTGGLGKESILSIAVKAYGEPEYVCTVKAGNFNPAPNVDSAVIRITNISRGQFASKHHEEVFFQIVKTGFAHKRKTLAGNLKNILEPEVVFSGFSACSLEFDIRAEDLRITDWHSLAQFVYNAQYGI